MNLWKVIFGSFLLINWSFFSFSAKDKDAAFHPTSQALSLYCSFLSLEDEVGRLFKLMQMGGGGGGWLTSKGVSNQVGPFLNFPPPFFFSANWVDGWDKPNGEETIQDRYKNEVKNGQTCCL